jgi:hypothetical protein
MPKYNPFGHAFKLSLLCGCAAIMAACTTTGPMPPQSPAPVVQRPVEPITPTPTETETPAPQEDQTKEVEVTDVEEAVEPPNTDQVADDGIYFNNRDGLTPPHMAGRDTKRLALLLPFSTSSSRLAQEAQSMYRAAEMAVFDRTGSDVLLIALDTKGTEAGARSATRAAIKAGADVILGPILAGNVRASSREARRSGTPLIAFSTDQPIFCPSHRKPKSPALSIMCPAQVPHALLTSAPTVLMAAASKPPMPTKSKPMRAK